MDHGVAVRADWLEILHGVEHVVRSYRGQRDHVVNMDKPRPDSPEHLLEVEPAHLALRAVVPDAGRSGFRITLIAVHQNLRYRTL